MNILKELLKRGLINDQNASSIEEEVGLSRKTEEEIILEKEIISEDSLFQIKSEILNIPLKSISPENIDLKTLEFIPEESARYYKMIPLSRDGNSFDIGMIYPENSKAKEALEFLARQSGSLYNIYLIAQTDFEKLLRRYKTLKEEVNKALEEFEENADGRAKEGSLSKDSEIEKIVEDAPISKMVAVILRHAVDGKASDVHIEPGKEKVRVRFRLDGMLYPSLFLPIKIHPALVSRIKILCSLKIDETRMPQDGRFSAKINDNNVDFRVSTLPTSFGEKVVIRILDSTQRKIDFDLLGISGKNLELIKKTLEKPFGLILSTGPTGSGKTTTLYTIINALNEEKRNIVTLEDPIEYFVEGISQSQVKPEIGYDFANGLRHILRQDPDTIMIGEIRDKETASLAIHAALTGHIVLSTLHTSNSFGVIPRLIDMGVKKFLIPPTLKIAIAQRLVRKLCPYCKNKVKIDTKIEEMIKKEIESIPLSTREQLNIKTEEIYVYEAVGCIKCRKIGYSGRIGIYEVLEMTDEIKDIVLKDPSESKIKKEFYNQGMITMRQDGILKVFEGITTIEEVLRATEED